MDKHRSDVILAMEYLAGTRNEKARKALVRALRNYQQPLSNAIRSMIAALLDPDHVWESREIVIRPRRRGKQPQYARDLQIAIDIVAETAAGTKLESALAIAEERHGVKTATVWRAWKKRKRDSSQLVRTIK
jgi:hypothetical protein